ncbi:uncharacterized protein LOC125210354 [Salvia hispanica]|uniref:uncharacterized protein LOC125210354 n=1 Tax=Salvia hispanica TaxID=49212 RepID=UPI0020091345|nr:uncharacterized protein LOC125210354 [Salvia hispanica]
MSNSKFQYGSVYLPLTLWTRSVVEKITSSIGTSVAVDQTTIRRRSLDGPRVQVQIILDMQKDLRDTIELFLPNGSSLQQRIAFENLPKICHTCHVFGHATFGCPGPAERAKIREENRKRELSRQRPNARDPSRGRDTTVRRSANSRATHDTAVVTHGVWKRTMKNQNNAYKIDVPSSSQDPLIRKPDNREMDGPVQCGNARR